MLSPPAKRPHNNPNEKWKFIYSLLENLNEKGENMVEFISHRPND